MKRHFLKNPPDIKKQILLLYEISIKRHVARKKTLRN